MKKKEKEKIAMEVLDIVNRIIVDENVRANLWHRIEDEVKDYLNT